MPVCVRCSAMSVASSMPAPASSTNDAAICVTAKSRRRRFVPGVMRMLPAERPGPVAASADGSRGTNARSTAATTASTAPTQSSVASTVTSARAPRSARRSAPARSPSAGPPGCRAPRPTPQSTRLSASSVRRSAAGLAPSAARTASSPSRRTDRARIRFATFEQAMMKTSAEAASSTSRIVRAGDTI